MLQASLVLLLLVLSRSESIPSTEKCECSQVYSEAECKLLQNCTWDFTTVKCLKSTEAQPTQPPISVLCGALQNPETKCRLTLGCAFLASCQQFSGCTAYQKTTNDECQAISSLCVSDGKSCIDIKPCSQYASQNLCVANSSTSGSKRCRWNTNLCQDQVCADADKALDSDEKCAAFLTGCVTIGRGCASAKEPCQNYPADCIGYIGSDGHCEVVDGKCQAKDCKKADSTITTDLECKNYSFTCVTTGLGCHKNPLPLCSDYTPAKVGDCESLIGLTGKCAFDTDSTAVKCKVRDCTTASKDLKTDTECNAYLTGCVTTGKGCVAIRPLCNTYSGTNAECSLFQGSDGFCRFFSETPTTTSGPCSPKICTDAPVNYNSDSVCQGYQIGCFTNGRGCVKEKQSCKNYKGTAQTCQQFIGLEGRCTGLATQAATDSCQAMQCSDASVSLRTNEECRLFKQGCISNNGAGCTTPPASCDITTNQMTCSGMSSCRWSSTCVTRACISYTTVTLCTTNRGAGNKKCLWSASTKTCSEIACRDAPSALKTDAECDNFQSGCVTTTQGCVPQYSNCSMFTGNQSTCSNFLGASKKPCYSLSATSNGACKERECSDNTIATSSTDCDKFLAGCLLRGVAGCIVASAPCSQYTGSPQICLQMRGENQTKKCANDTGSSGACRNARCDDNKTDNSDASCGQFIQGCLTKGNGCIEPSAPCSSYPGSSQAACGAFTGNGKKCWWISGTNCVDKVCTQNTVATTDVECTTFLAGCMFSGTAGCIANTGECSLFSGNEIQCANYKGNGTPCTRKSPCTNRLCSEATGVTSQADCLKYSPSCRFDGSKCIDATTCTLYTGLTEAVCKQITDQNGGKCWSGTNTCTQIACSHLTGAASQQDCDNFKSNCTFSGTSCVEKQASCSGYTSFTQAQCKAAKTISGELCWKEASGDGACESRQCSNTVVNPSADSCANHLSTCQFNGTACTPIQSSCTGYTGFTQDACKLVKTSGQISCWKETAGVGSCSVRQCSDTVVAPSATTCANHLSTCRFNGTICVNSQASCTTYTSFTQAACREVTTTTGTRCWRIQDTVGTCIERLCTDAPDVNAMGCENFSSTCRFNGTSCVVAQAACTSYTGFTQAACRATSDSNQIKCWRVEATSGTCSDRTCDLLTTGASYDSCTNHQSTCRFDGTSLCVAGRASCTEYSEFTQAACRTQTTLSGVKCWRTSADIGQCENRSCSNVISNPNDANCAAHLTGCIYNGSSGCVEAKSSCSDYNLLFSICRTVRTTNGTRCWLASGTGACQTRVCTHNTTATTDGACQEFLAGCVTNGSGCVAASNQCSTFNGTSDGCLGFIGNGIRCKGGVSSTGSCSPRLCQDNTTATSDSECSTSLAGCVTRGQGCFSTQEPCSSYMGTQQQCAQFQGAGRKCWNTDSASILTPCTIRVCGDNKTAATDIDCQNFQSGCVTNGKGCVANTAPCSSYSGTAAECNNFVGTSGAVKCSNIATATITTSCVARECKHNTTATTDSQCEAFFPGCITTGIGCAPKLACSQYTGTMASCSKLSATDKPCGGHPTLVQACYAQKCTDAPNSFATDAECMSFKSGCKTNGMGCIDGNSCDQILTEKVCMNRPDCLFGPSCRDFGICSTLKNASLCMMTPSTTRCVWSGTACREWTCTDAPTQVELNSHEYCAAFDTKCTTKGRGCQPLAPCSTYTDQVVCKAAQSTEPQKRCQWDSNVCRPLRCEDAPKRYTSDTLCQGWIATGNCKTNGYGCITSPFTCSQLLVRSTCLQDSAGNACLWFPNREVKCVQFNKCTDIIGLTHEQCQEYSTGCTTDGSSCVPISLCANYLTRSACTRGFDGVCGWSAGENKCQRFTACTDIKGTTSDMCLQYNATCITDGTMCISKGPCTSYTNITTCGNTDKDGVACVWDTQCRQKECKDFVDASSGTHAYCASVKAQTPCTTNGTVCVPQGNCSTYQEKGCFQGLDGPCIFQNTCRVKNCQDFEFSTTASCSAAMSSCISDGARCLPKSICASYSSQATCNSGGTDGMCAFTGGTCKLMTQCADAGTDSLACSQKDVCKFVNGACVNKSCTDVAIAGQCKPLWNFPRSSITVCVKKGDSCQEGLGSELTSQNSDCAILTNSAYYFNLTDSTCRRCKQTITENPSPGGSGGNTNGGSTSSTSGEKLVWLSFLMGLIYI